MHDVIDSTNRRALDLADDGVPDGFVVIADRQTAGRGRRGRTWESNSGDSLLMSLVVRSTRAATRWEWLPLASAVAVARVLGDLPGVSLKWPNDVLARGHKISGILVERRTSGDVRAPAVVGIGLNVNQKRFPDDLATSATSIRMETGVISDRTDLALTLLAEFRDVLSDWKAGAESIPRAYRDLLGGLGSPADVRPFDGSDTVHGVIEGVDAGGRLVLRTGDGLRTFAAGEITLRSR